MELREHAPQRGEIASRAKLQPLHQQVCLTAVDPVLDRLRRRTASASKRGKAIRLGGKGVRHGRVVDLEETFGDPIAAVDAAAADRLAILELQPEVRRVLARLRRSTRMPMKARSNLLRQEMLACSSAPTRMRRMRESALAVTVAPRSGLPRER